MMQVCMSSSVRCLSHRNMKVEEAMKLFFSQITLIQSYIKREYHASMKATRCMCIV